MGAINLHWESTLHLKDFSYDVRQKWVHLYN